MPRKAKVQQKKVRMLLNALHTMGGGGQVYLQGILPGLAADERLELHLLAPQATLAMLNIPQGVQVHEAPITRFGTSHLWEQTVLPVLARWWGCQVVLSNANYGPLLAPRACVILHTTPRAAAAWCGAYWKCYWRGLRMFTHLSLLRAPCFFSVAKHIVADYANAKTARKMRLAPPAVGFARPPEPPKRDPNLVLAVGDFYPQKNYPLLLRAFAKLREANSEARLTIVGRPVQAKVRDEVLSQARELKILEALTLIPGVPHTQLMTLMMKASVYISTSCAEAFNMPVLEAMHCGTPVVVLDTAFQREVAGDGAYAGALFVPPTGNDVPAALAIAVLGILTNPGIAQTLTKRGLKRAENFTWAHTATVLAEGVTETVR